MCTNFCPLGKMLSVMKKKIEQNYAQFFFNNQKALLKLRCLQQAELKRLKIG